MLLGAEMDWSETLPSRYRQSPSFLIRARLKLVYELILRRFDNIRFTIFSLWLVIYKYINNKKKHCVVSMANINIWL